MKIRSFDYNLPSDRVAQFPASIRDEAKLLVLDRRREDFRHAFFRDLPDILIAGDVLVLNDTRVFPSRLLGTKIGGGGKVEVLLVRELEPGLWEALARSPGKPGTEFDFGNRLRGIWLGGGVQGKGRIRFPQIYNVRDVVEEIGHVPLPPYIVRNGNEGPGREEEDRKRYQTIYALAPESVAAPTAGLHFTRTLMDRLRQRGIEIVFVTLHVGIGTFLPVRSEEVDQHVMEPERYEVSVDTAARINGAKKEGRHLVAVGTTTTRLLESMASVYGRCVAGRGETDLFIYPGHQFGLVDALITNFHLPRSTPLLLASAFAGWEKIRRAYEEAIRRDYRFCSFGDSMLVL